MHTENADSLLNQRFLYPEKYLCLLFKLKRTDVRRTSCEPIIDARDKYTSVDVWAISKQSEIASHRADKPRHRFMPIALQPSCRAQL